jgi:hypothetical protein
MAFLQDFLTQYGDFRVIRNLVWYFNATKASLYQTRQKLHHFLYSVLEVTPAILNAAIVSRIAPVGTFDMLHWSM